MTLKKDSSEDAGMNYDPAKVTYHPIDDAFWNRGDKYVAEIQIYFVYIYGNLKHEASKTFRTIKREHLEDNISELDRNSKNKNVRDMYRVINKLEKDYQLRTNLVKDEYFE